MCVWRPALATPPLCDKHVFWAFQTPPAATTLDPRIFNNVTEVFDGQMRPDMRAVSRVCTQNPACLHCAPNRRQ